MSIAENILIWAKSIGRGNIPLETRFNQIVQQMRKFADDIQVERGERDASAVYERLESLLETIEHVDSYGPDDEMRLEDLQELLRNDAADFAEYVSKWEDKMAEASPAEARRCFLPPKYAMRMMGLNGEDRQRNYRIYARLIKALPAEAVDKTRKNSHHVDAEVWLMKCKEADGITDRRKCSADESAEETAQVQERANRQAQIRSENLRRMMGSK